MRNEETIEEWVRMKLHTYIVTSLIVFNTLYLLPSAVISLLGMMMGFKVPFPIVRFDEINWIAYYIFLNIPLLTWFYSTITQPLKKGYKILVDWKTTEKGRLLAGILNGASFISLLWVGAAKYTEEYMEPLLSPIRVEDSHLFIESTDTLLYFLYLFPLLITPLLLLGVATHISKNPDIKKYFFKWEFPLLSSLSFSLTRGSCDVIVGWDKETKKPIILKENSRFLHELVVGATGSGKTSTSILIRILQDLIRIAKGKKMSLVLLEPKGDAVLDVINMAKKLGIPEEKIKVIDPTKQVKSMKFNPFYGPLETAAESFRGVLDSLTGDQDEFFKGQQNETAALFTMLAKLRYGNLANITHIQRMYTDPRFLADMTESVRNRIDDRKDDPSLTDEERRTFEKYERIVRYFEDEVLEYKTFATRDGDRLPATYPPGHRYEGMQVVENKKDKYVTGAKKYLNDISMNSMLSDLMIAEDNDEVLDLDEFLKEGGILLVNTALGELEELSILLGQFFIRQFQSAVFRRPREEEGNKRIPGFFYVDEFPLYINEAFERLLTLGRSYKVGTLIAIQSLGQLEKVIQGYEKSILTNASTKTVFGRGFYQDNETFSKQFGEYYVVEESLNESVTPVTVDKQSWGYRYNSQRTLTPRFTPTEIAELPFKHMIVQIVEDDGSQGEARIATGQFVNETKMFNKFIKLNELDLSTKRQKEIAISIDQATDVLLGTELNTISLSGDALQASAEAEDRINNTKVADKEIPVQLEEEAKFDDVTGNVIGASETSINIENEEATSFTEDFGFDYLLQELNGESEEPLVEPSHDETLEQQTPINNVLKEEENDSIPLDGEEYEPLPFNEQNETYFESQHDIKAVDELHSDEIVKKEWAIQNVLDDFKTTGDIATTGQTQIHYSPQEIDRLLLGQDAVSLESENHEELGVDQLNEDVQAQEPLIPIEDGQISKPTKEMEESIHTMLTEIQASIREPERVDDTDFPLSSEDESKSDGKNTEQIESTEDHSAPIKHKNIYTNFEHGNDDL